MILPANISEQGKQFAYFLKEWIESGIAFDARLAVLVRRHWGISSDEGQILAPLVLMMVEPWVRQRYLRDQPQEERESGHAEQAGAEHGHQRESEQAG